MKTHSKRAKKLKRGMYVKAWNSSTQGESSAQDVVYIGHVPVVGERFTVMSLQAWQNHTGKKRKIHKDQCMKFEDVKLLTPED